MNISIEEMPREIDRLLEENEKLQEDLEYSNHCDEELRKKITNLNYKIKLLEEQHIDTLEQKNKYINTLEQSLNDAEQEIERLKQRIDKAIEYIEDNYMTYKEASAYRDGIDNDYKIQISSIADLIDILKGSEQE